MIKMHRIEFTQALSDGENSKNGFKHDDRGMGIRRKVIPLMKEHNNSELKFEAPEDHFKVTLWTQQTKSPT